MNLEPLTPEDLVNELQRRWVTPVPPAVITTPPSRGALARASWDGFTQLVLVASSTEAEVVGYPIELGRADEHADLVYLSGELTTLNVPLTAPAQPRTFPPVLFDATVGQAIVDDWESAIDKGVQPLTQAPQHVDAFADVDEFLARWVAQSQSQSVVDIFAAAGITVTQIKDVLAISGAAAVKMRRGERRISGEDAARLSEVLQLSLDDLLQASMSIPQRLRIALSQIKYRPVMERLRARAGSFAAAFDDLAAGALNAARADSSEVDWEHRIDRYIEGAGL